MSRLIRTVFVLAAAAIVSLPASRLAAFQEVTKTIYFTAVDAKSGKPITDLKAEELAAAEDGQFRPASALKKADTPVSILMLADTTKEAGGTGLDRRSTSGSAAGELIRDIRAAFSEFTKQMLAANPQNELALMEFGQASIMVTNFTSNGEEIEKGITKLIPKPSAASVLLEAILESGKELDKRKNARRAIVSINVEPGDEQSREPPNNILKQLAKAHAQYFSVALQKGDLRNNARGMVVDGLTEAMGGRHDAIVGQSALVGILKQYGELINAQYEMQYSRPMGVNPQVLQIATRRPAGTVKFMVSKLPPQ